MKRTWPTRKKLRTKNDGDLSAKSNNIESFDDSDDSSSNSEDDPTFVVEDQRKETSKNKLEEWFKKIPKPSALKDKIKVKEALWLAQIKARNNHMAKPSNYNSPESESVEKNEFLHGELELAQLSDKKNEDISSNNNEEIKGKGEEFQFSEKDSQMDQSCRVESHNPDINDFQKSSENLETNPLILSVKDSSHQTSGEGIHNSQEFVNTSEKADKEKIIDSNEAIHISQEHVEHTSTETERDHSLTNTLADVQLDEADLNAVFNTVTTENHTRKKKDTATCKFCSSDVTNYERHLQRKHSDEKQVKEFLALKKGSNDRRKLLKLLRNEVKFNNFIQSSSYEDDTRYACCYCKGLFARNYLCRHKKFCPVKKEDSSPSIRTNHLAGSQTMIACISDVNNSASFVRLRNEVFSIMKPDKISFIAKSDPLIRFFGDSYLKKHSRPQMKYCCSNKMRELARLLMEIRTVLNNEKFTFIDAIDPEMFDLVAHCSRKIAGYDEENKSYRAGSLAAHLGTSLKQAASLLTRVLYKKDSFARVSDYEKKLKDVKRFRCLVTENWTGEVASLALKSVNEKKWNKPVILPLTSDVNKFRIHVIQVVEESIQLLKTNESDEKAYRNLVEGTLALIILFNRRRIGDVQYVHLESYYKNFSTNNAEECLKALSPTEKALTKYYKRIVTGGKGSRPVVILLPKNLQRYVDFMIKIRKTGMVPSENPYLFALPKAADRWIPAQKVLSKFAKNADLENPSTITSNKLRKQIASIMQILNLDEEASAQFAQFMGHTEKVHNDFYKLPQDLYQTAKVSKLLILMENGQGDKYKGKSLSEIDIDPNIDTAEEEEEEDEFLDAPSETSDSDDDYNRPILTKQKNRQMAQKTLLCRRNRWSKEEGDIVKKTFHRKIQNKQPAKKEECEALLKEHPDIFQGRTWKMIKAYVYNQCKKK